MRRFCIIHYSLFIFHYSLKRFAVSIREKSKPLRGVRADNPPTDSSVGGFLCRITQVLQKSKAFVTDRRGVRADNPPTDSSADGFLCRITQVLQKSKAFGTDRRGVRADNPPMVLRRQTIFHVS